MEIYIKEIQCDWYMGSEDFYEKTQITIDLIKKIKKVFYGMRRMDHIIYMRHMMMLIGFRCCSEGIWFQ